MSGLLDRGVRIVFCIFWSVFRTVLGGFRFLLRGVGVVLLRTPEDVEVRLSFATG